MQSPLQVFPREDGALGVARERLVPYPAVPAQPPAAALPAGQLTDGHFVRLQYELHVEIQARPHVQADQMSQQEE